MKTTRTRRLTLVLAGCSVTALTWVVLTWQWREPATSLYAAYEQRRLAATLDTIARQRAWTDGPIARVAARFRGTVAPGDPIGRLRIPRIGLDAVLVEGTDEATLRKGPGRDARSLMPGEGRLVYVAGHRTSYLAPFGEIDELRKGDRLYVDMPYADLTYEVTDHAVVDDGDLTVLRSPDREVLRLQTCHPPFFASARYVVSAELVRTSADIPRVASFGLRPRQSDPMDSRSHGTAAGAVRFSKYATT